MSLSQTHGQWNRAEIVKCQNAIFLCPSTRTNPWNACCLIANGSVVTASNLWIDQPQHGHQGNVHKTRILSCIAKLYDAAPESTIQIHGCCMLLANSFTAKNSGHELSILLDRVAYVRQHPEITSLVCLDTALLFPNNLEIVKRLLPTLTYVYLKPDIIYQFDLIHTKQPKFDNIMLHQDLIAELRLDFSTDPKAKPLGEKIVLIKCRRNQQVINHKTQFHCEKLLQILETKHDYKYINPEITSIQDLGYALMHATNILVSWGSILYTHMILFNPQADVVVLFPEKYMKGRQPFFQFIFDRPKTRIFPYNPKLDASARDTADIIQKLLVPPMQTISIVKDQRRFPDCEWIRDDQGCYKNTRFLCRASPGWKPGCLIQHNKIIQSSNGFFYGGVTGIRARLKMTLALNACIKRLKKGEEACKIAGKALLLANEWTAGNSGHELSLLLSRIALARTQTDITVILLYECSKQYPNNLAQVQLLLPPSNYRYVFLKPGIVYEFEEVMLNTPVCTDIMRQPALISELKQYYRGISSPIGKKIILIKSHLNQQVHDPTTQFQCSRLFTELSKLGFEIINPEKVPIYDLAPALLSADCILAGWGSILYSHMFYFNPSAKIIVLQPRAENKHFWKFIYEIATQIVRVSPNLDSQPEQTQKILHLLVE